MSAIRKIQRAPLSPLQVSAMQAVSIAQRAVTSRARWRLAAVLGFVTTTAALAALVVGRV